MFKLSSTFGTGISDHNKLVSTILKSGSFKGTHKMKIWKRVKPFFNEKGSNFSKITLVEEDNIISNEEEIANILDNYFINVTKTLNLKKQLGVGRSGVNKFENP